MNAVFQRESTTSRQGSETVHDRRKRQRRLITYNDGHVITPIPIDGSYLRGSLLNAVMRPIRCRMEEVTTLP